MIVGQSDKGHDKILGVEEEVCWGNTAEEPGGLEVVSKGHGRK